MTRSFVIHRAATVPLTRTQTDDYWIKVRRGRGDTVRYSFCVEDFERLTGLTLKPGDWVRVRLTRTRRTP